MRDKFVVGSRSSQLALAQTGIVQSELRGFFASLQFDVKTIKTAGDQVIDQPWGELNLKGAFTKELDDALFKNEIDLAVHSLKDLPSVVPNGLVLRAVTKCIDPRDAWVARENKTIAQMKSDAVVGTSSLRRGALVLKKKPKVKIKVLRGNVDTRLRKLDAGEYDAIVLAAAGLKRLGKEGRITEYLDPFEFVPAIGQGMLAIICRESDFETKEVVEKINDPDSYQVASAQRAFMVRMEGGCQIPLGCYGEIRGKELFLIGFLSTPDASREVSERLSGPIESAMKLGDRLAQKMIQKGGKEILQSLVHA